MRKKNSLSNKLYTQLTSNVGTAGNTRLLDETFTCLNTQIQQKVELLRDLQITSYENLNQHSFKKEIKCDLDIIYSRYIVRLFILD